MKPLIPVEDLTHLRFLTLKEAAIYLRLTPKGLRHRLSAGTVPSWCYSRLGGDYRFNRVALDELLGADDRSQRLAKKAS